MSRLRAGTVLFTLLLAAWTGCAGPSPQETADLPRPTDADTRPLPDLADAAVPDLLPEARVDRTDGPGDLSGETVDAEPDSGDGGSDVEVASVDSDGDGLTDGEELALGTDPMVEDSDGDGFGDGEEVGLGTDPADPSSALAWQPGWEEGYPRLVFGADEVEALRLKAAEPGKHGATMMGRILAAALSEPAPPKPEAYDAGYEAGRARIAMEAAFLGLLNEDPAYAHKALEIGIHLNPNVDEVGFAHPAYNKTDIHAAETVAYYAKTYDFLRGSGLVSETELGELEAALADLVTRLEQSATKGPLAAMLMLAQNNHNIKTYGAIGLAGIALAHRPEAARWVSRGVTEVRYYFLDYQTTADGGYAEGPNYLVYGMGEAMSLLRAFHRFADGEETYLRHFYDTRETQEMVYEWIPDPLLEPLLHDLFRWPIRLMMPGGLSPNFDDNNLSALPGGYLAALFQDPVFLWHWELPAVNFSSGAGISLAPDILALLDEAMVPQPPDFPPDQLLYEAGNCIFRSDFGETAQYALLLGEHGKIRKHGQGHEHPDASQLILHAHGEYLLLDSGYISWEEKEAVCHPENHNLVLVDGLGPPDSEYTGIGSDTFLEDFAVGEDGVKRCRSRTKYQGVDLERLVVVAPAGLVVVVDSLGSEVDHDYRILWHGNGGGSSGGDFFLEGYGARWERPGASLRATVTTTEGVPDCDSVAQAHGMSHSFPQIHETLRCLKNGAGLHFLTVLNIVAGDMEQVEIPEVITLDEGPFAGLFGPHGDGFFGVCFLPDGTQDVTNCPTPCGEIDLVEGLNVTFFGGGCEVVGSIVIPGGWE